MKTSQFLWTPAAGWSTPAPALPDADLVLAFADAEHFRSAKCFEELKALFPTAHIVGCSSSGSVYDTHLDDGDIVATAIRFERGTVKMAVSDMQPGENVEGLATGLMEKLRADDLRHVFVLSDGLNVNGSDLAKGFNSIGIAVTGGLAGDGTRFAKTWVMADAPAQAGRVVALGFYGDLTVKSGCFAGWQEFGAERVVTKSTANVVYEIDGQPALALYKKYLGDLAADLPGSGLRFPLSVQADKNAKSIIRTLLAVDEDAQSLTFAGDVPQGYICKLMKTNLDNLIDSAGMAAAAAKPGDAGAAGLCLVVSCVGRRLVLGQLVEEELEIVRENLGKKTALTGFYSYGELAPFSDILQCQLHNQTMTLTTIYE
ncbi:MAG: FIST C-terminal domain-containing protein [Sulfuricella sp.]|nr:FIST C-terminal domain-containing protein [Sulfuricella sp.]